ncbi:SulP family inorganic anion transporter [Rhodobacteraceae bacterium HSP-20]|uniref:SulP family inorganic anion transporter n=1 Tax=Paragemmobacter amnigenus TaxID=2852097 RepID=A0ABS6J8A5_9RHOB|nr:SulP family inorganic anion transporter [Rhodobacter amnigenus]MBU9699827.1 SulP family inorganic anion transporter [Rhodobacter amnigenus]MBV4391054.1 SulP family inorganic anion transporter [Rhodobacter amnigenus]
MTDASHPAQTAEFLPKIVTVLREGYTSRDLRADALAGLTVAIVALPLSMAIAIASGVGPERGLYTTIVGGFLVSLLGGSRFQIGGPAGAFIVLVSACVMAVGVEGLILATFLSGFLLMAAGVLRLGTYIRFIPYPVTVGFTAGIAVIIFASQIRDLFGLTLAGPEPGEIVGKIETLWAARGTVTWAAVAVALGVVAVIQGIKRWRPGAPGMLLAVVLASVAVAGLGLEVETIGSKFGALPNLPPAPALPVLDGAAMMAALPWAVSFALLGAIESLLSAVVADGMSGARHRSNAELVAQGAANVGSALFGGFCVTGTIARTATNVRAGSRGPVSGMLHALFVLGFMLVAAPLAGFIPLAALAGVLAVVAWNMAEKEEFWHLLRSSRADALVLVVTFLLVVFRDLTEGIVVGFALGGLVFIARMSEAAEVAGAEAPDVTGDRVVVRLSGPWFFGAAARLGSVLEKIADRPREFVVDVSEVPMIDSSGARSFLLLARRMARRDGVLVVAGARPALRAALEAQGLRGLPVRFVPDLSALD